MSAHLKLFYKIKNESEFAVFRSDARRFTLEAGTHGPDHFGLQGETADENFRAWGVKTPRVHPPGLLKILF